MFNNNKYVAYGVDIFLQGRTFRFSTHKIVRAGLDEDGTIIYYPYIPYIKKFTPPTSEIEYKEFSAIPNAKITLADFGREVVDGFSDLDYEEARVTLYLFSESQTVLSSLDGYMTDHEFEDGTLEFTIRFNEDDGALDLLTPFTHEDFQYNEILTPREVSTVTNFTIQEDTPWTVFKVAYQSARIGKQRFVVPFGGEYSDWAYGTHQYTNPPQGLPPSTKAPVIKLEMDQNVYEVYSQVDAFMLKVGSLDASSGYTYTFTVGGTAISYTISPGDTAIDVLEGLEADAVSKLGAGKANVLEAELRLYVEGDPSTISSVSIDDGFLFLFYDPDTAGSESILKKQHATLFDTTPINSDTGEPYADRSGEDPATATTPYSMAYFKAVVGNGEYQGTPEVIAYLYCTQGEYYNSELELFITAESGVWYLSGIPSLHDNNPGGSVALATMVVNDPDVSDASTLVNKYGVINKHKHGEVIAPYGGKDKVYIAANGLTPIDEGDPELGVGFVNLGGTIADDTKFNYLFFHRYKLTDIFFNVYDDNRYTGELLPEVLELEIHCRPPSIDPAHSFTAGGKQAIWELRSADPDIGDRARLGSYEGMVNYIDFNLQNIPDEVYELLNDPSIETYRDSLRDRYRGARVDMIEDFEDFQQTISKNTQFSGNEPVVSDYKKINNKLLNNTNGKFAICTSSEIVFDDVNSNFVYERLYFADSSRDIPDRIFIPADVIESEESVLDYELKFRYDTDRVGANFFLNHLTYKPTWDSVDSQEDSWDLSQSENFFLKGNYRVIHQPVPEGSDDLGRNYPIVYGFVKDVPLLHVVSKKTFTNNFSTAGDDIYIYASHPCDVANPSDLIIRMKDGDTDSETGKRLEDFSPNLKFDLIQNPFPNKVEGHYAVKQETASLFPRVEFVGDLFDPYYETNTFETLAGTKLWGLKLLGDKWDYRAGKLDKRYPIRNGVGNTKLYASFGGWKDTRGEITGYTNSLIHHPCDILKHFIGYYGTYPLSSDILDDDNLARVKGLTPKYTAAVYLDTDIERGTFIQDLCKQFGYFTYVENGKLKISVFNDEIVDYSKPISEGLNLLNTFKEVNEGYKDIYNEVIFDFDIDRSNSTYQGRVKLDKTNNIHCSRASRAKGGKRSFKIEANYVTSYAVAREVANTYAKILCRRYKTFELEVLDTDGIDFQPGDLVPLTRLESGLDESPVIIKSVQRLSGKSVIKVIRYY